MPTIIQVRRDTMSGWATNGAVVLAAGEKGYETDTGNFKIGDGTTQWSSLAYQMPYNKGSRLSAANATLTIDNDNDRVGIGTDTPQAGVKLDVSGNAAVSGNSTIGGTLTVTGDVVATNLTGTIQTAAQPNITSTGALTVPSISVTGNITGSTVGALAASLLPSGSVLQVVEAVTTTVTDYTLTAGWAAISGMSVTITPKRATSKIFVIASWQSYLFAAATGSSWVSARIMRGATELSTHGAVQFGSATVSTMSQLCIFDSESSPGTSAVTYSLELQSSRGISGSTYNPQAVSVGWSSGFGGNPNSRHRIIVVEVAV